ncbi:hypothetical protein NB2BOR_A28530 [Bordetella parapertussis]|nr:hypothetical protein NB2BOR_A28530 [Bordetella parapertussis]
MKNRRQLRIKGRARVMGQAAANHRRQAQAAPMGCRPAGLIPSHPQRRAATRARSLPREMAAMKVRNGRRAVASKVAASRTRRRFLPSRRRRQRTTASMSRVRIP